MIITKTNCVPPPYRLPLPRALSPTQTYHFDPSRGWLLPISKNFPQNDRELVFLSWAVFLWEMGPKGLKMTTFHFERDHFVFGLRPPHQPILGLKGDLIPKNPLKMESCHFEPFWAPPLKETGPNSKKQVPYHFGMSFFEIGNNHPREGSKW